jgi:hypothetical protein
MNAADDARRLGLILFQNKGFSENEPILKSHLRQPQFWSELFDLAHPPGARKCSQIFNAYENLVREARES